MKKVLALILALVLTLGATSALADLVIVQNKVEIDAALQEYAKLYTEKTGVPVKVISGGGSSDYNTVLKNEMAQDRQPDIFVFEGPSGYEMWKDRIVDMAGADWTANTSMAYMDGDKVVGFPVAIEGYGLAYNKEILDKAGIDPATLTTVDAYKAAFEKLDSMKAELGLDMVVSMVAGTSQNMTWVTGLH
ncbi:MAG: extracellular solute-binding protein, partial [Clostridia bacterium]|nr:extracellular solute-binding protein [Clostridia bacterium]